MPALEMSAQLFAIFSALVEEAAGIHYGAGDRELFATKVADQAADAGYATLLDYYYRLRYDDPSREELRALLEALVVHETYFFRELAPLAELVRGPLANTVAKRGRARVWSAACSTGEEPLSLAMLLAEAGMLARVEIVATDLSRAAIERARSGVHGRRALREPYPHALAQRFLEPIAQGVLAPHALREAIRFDVVNLLDAAAVAALGTFDVILCRNVLIYFSDEEVARTVGRLTSALAPGGVLAVGVSESLLRYGTSLVCEERGGAFFYRRAA